MTERNNSLIVNNRFQNTQIFHEQIFQIKKYNGDSNSTAIVVVLAELELLYPPNFYIIG